MVFGVISPKIKMSSVSTPVQMPTAALPNIRIAMDVAREEAPIFTRLLPIKMVLSILPELPVTFRRVLAFLFHCSARVWIRILFAVVIEVSADEKNAERHMRMIKTRNCMASLESN